MTTIPTFSAPLVRVERGKSEAIQAESSALDPHSQLPLAHADAIGRDRERRPTAESPSS